MRPPAILLSQPANTATLYLQPIIEAGGYVVFIHELGSIPAVDFRHITAAVVNLNPTDSNNLRQASAQTRRWRVELEEEQIPIIWVLDAPNVDNQIFALESGADLCLAQPLDSALLIAQLKAAQRARTTSAHVWEKAERGRLLGSQLQRMYAARDQELDLARRIHRSFERSILPEIGGGCFAISHHTSAASPSCYDVFRLDEAHVGFYLADILSIGGTMGELLNIFLHRTVKLKEILGDRYRLIAPSEALTHVNAALLTLNLADPPLVAMIAGILNVEEGTIELARAGMPAPFYLPSGGMSTVWNLPGPYLGTAESTYELYRSRLNVGDQLILNTNPRRVDGLAMAVECYCDCSGKEFVENVGRNLMQSDDQEGFTLLGIEMRAHADIRLRAWAG